MARRHRSRWDSFKAIVDLWVDLFKEHNLLTYASAIAFQSLVALVALLLLGIALLDEFGRRDVWTEQIAPHIEPKVLHDVFAGMNATVEKIFHSSSVGLITFAALLTVWEMSGVVRACMGALSRIYGHDDERPWWIRFPISIGIGFVVTVGVVGAVLLATAAKGAVGGAWQVPWGILRWLLAVLLIGLAFGVLARYAPAQTRPTRWATAGAALVVVAWIVQAVIFAWYLRDLADYRTAVGSLLGVYFLTTFLYVAAIILLVGIELDEQIRRDLQDERRHGILALARDLVG